ncbi:MAG: elongation factor G [Limnochordia bacterium]
MKSYSSERLRNLALVSHGGAGKTSIAESMLFSTGAINRLGRVDDGTSILDYDPEEVRRKISISSSLGPCEWKGHKLNVIDTPGYFDFAGEVKAALRVVEGTVIVVCAASGVEVGTEKVWGYANDCNLPRMIFVNKMDRENADFFKVLGELTERLGNKAIPIQIPMGAADNFRGIVDLVKMKAYVANEKGKFVESAIPEDLMSEAESYREALIDAVAVGDEELMMKYLEGETLTQEEVELCLGLATKSGDVIPVLCGSANKVAGIDLLMDYCIECLPSPVDAGAIHGTNPKTEEDAVRQPSPDEPLSALVFKTMADPYVGKMTIFRVYSGVFKSDSQVYNANKDKDERIGQVFLLMGKEQEPVEQVVAGDIAAVAKVQVTATNDTLCAKDQPIVLDPIEFPAPKMAMAVQPKSKGDEEKVGVGLARLAEEDPTFSTERKAETKETLIYGVGELHLEIITSRLQKKFGVEVDLVPPKIPYRETLRGKVKVEGKHKKQTGGRGQYGHVWLELEPAAPGEGFVFEDKIFGGAVPRQYIPAVEKGLRETMEEGVLAGYPVVDVKAALVDGSYHSVDSSEMAFKIAASMAFKKGFLDARPALLEPIMRVEVEVPQEYMGDVMGDLNKKRGRILGMEPKQDKQIIRALVPQSEMARFAIDLRSMTQGRGDYTMEFDSYEEVPANLAEQVIEASKEEEE